MGGGKPDEDLELSGEGQVQRSEEVEWLEQSLRPRLTLGCSWLQTAVNTSPTTTLTPRSLSCLDLLLHPETIQPWEERRPHGFEWDQRLVGVSANLWVLSTRRHKKKSVKVLMELLLPVPTALPHASRLPCCASAIPAAPMWHCKAGNTLVPYLRGDRDWHF